MIRFVVRKLLPSSIYKELRRRWALLQLLGDVRKHPTVTRPDAHALPGELIVSLTSYGPRLATVHLTLQSLLNQTIRPDRLILWIAEGEAGRLPRTVTALAARGLEIRFVPDLLSYKKLVFAVREFPESFIVTADDDLFYRPHWLQTLVSNYKPRSKVLPAHRVHRVPPLGPDGLSPYLSWQLDVEDAAARTGGKDLLATCGAGVLFAPGSLHPDVVDQASFTTLCPTGDDLWFYWMIRRAGWVYKKVGDIFELTSWPGTEENCLFDENMTANDVQVGNLLARYGYPPSF